MSDTLLADVIRRHTAGSLLSVLSRTADKIAEQMAEEILRDPEFREEMRYLVRQAFRDTVTALHQPPPEPPKAEDLLGGLSQEVRDELQRRRDKLK